MTYGPAPDTFARYLEDRASARASDENDYFARAFDALGVPHEARQKPSLNRVTQAFRDLMMDEAGQGGYEAVLAVLVPAEWVYLTWATAVANQSPSRFYLKEWIGLHTDPGFGDFVAGMRGQLDHYGPELGLEGQAHLEALFRRTVELEVTFFDAAFD